MTVASVPSQNWFTQPDNLDQDWLIPYALAAGAIGVEIGDLMYDGGSDVALPAGQQASQGSLAADQVLFAANFIGCSLDKVLAAETNATRRLVVRTEGVKVFDCPSQVWVKGDLVGIYSDGATSPIAQKVDKVTTIDKAIGVVIKSSMGVASTTVTVYFIAKNYIGWKATGASLGDLTINSIVSGDSSLAISGKVGASSAGGVIAMAGGAGHGAGNAGGAITITGGLGVTTGAGGSITITGGAGGAGGVGGAVSMVGGAPTSGNVAGGAAALTGGAGSGTGAGGAVAIAAGASGAGATGNGGAITITGGAAASTNGNGGSVTLAAGALAGTGAPGKVKISGCNFHFGNAQTIDMADAEVALTLVPGTPTGTLVTSNVLAVDANSGTTEDLLLPPEADCNGLMLMICNTGGEDIVVKEDGDSTTICTISTAECGFVACDGTTWRGGVIKAT